MGWVPLQALAIMSLLFRPVGSDSITSGSATSATTSNSNNNNNSNSNPFHAGCLQHQLGADKWKPLRVCNSDDDATTMGVSCRPPPLPYPEIRMYTQNWQSVFFTSWLLQIILSELLDIPTTIETGYAEFDQMDFYTPTPPLGGFQIAPSVTLEMIEEGITYGDCAQANAENQQRKKQQHNNTDDNEDNEYQVCFHFVPEVWTADLVWIQDLLHRGLVEPPLGLGVLGQEALFIPKYTAEANPSLINYLALQGQDHRQELADMFLRPTSWQDYCQEVSLNNCTTPDSVAQRPPQGENDREDERNRYFHPQDYTGYFRATDKNNCTSNPDTCTGHVADFPCGWSSYVLPYLYHLDIALEGDGEEPNSKGYSYNQLQDIWRAANATRSHVMMTWWSPEPLFQAFLGTDAEFVKVQFPYPTQECVENRVDREDRCAPDLETRVGSPKGACDESPTPLMKMIATSIYDVMEEAMTLSGHSEATKSPGLDVLKSFKITELQLAEIFQLWNDGEGMDPRAAVCTWAAEHVDYLQSFVPHTYPRQVDGGIRNDALLYSALILGGIVTFIVLGTSAWVYQRRKSRVVAMARVDFLFLLLGGSFTIAIGAIVVAAPATNASCVAEIWLIGIGYTLGMECNTKQTPSSYDNLLTLSLPRSLFPPSFYKELVPLIVKVAAINKLMFESQRMRRIKLTKKKLFVPVFAIFTVVSAFLIAWTILDPPQKQSEYELTDDANEAGYTIVTSRYYCKSNSNVWNMVAVGWNVLFLFCATVLAIQMSRIPHQQQVSEARTLAFLIYSHTGFVVLRVITYFLSSEVNEWTLARCRSLIFSIDTLATIV